MSSLNLIPKLSFELKFRTFIINVCYKKSKRLWYLDSLLFCVKFCACVLLSNAIKKSVKKIMYFSESVDLKDTTKAYFV